MRICVNELANIKFNHETDYFNGETAQQFRSGQGSAGLRWRLTAQQNRNSTIQFSRAKGGYQQLVCFSKRPCSKFSAFSSTVTVKFLKTWSLSVFSFQLATMSFPWQLDHVDITPEACQKLATIAVVSGIQPSLEFFKCFMSTWNRHHLSPPGHVVGHHLFTQICFEPSQSS